MSYIKDTVYHEVMEFLKTKPDECQKIPEKILNHIEKHAKKVKLASEKKTTISSLSEEAFSLYLSLYLQYMAEDKEKDKIKKILIDNEVAYREKIKK